MTENKIKALDLVSPETSVATVGKALDRFVSTWTGLQSRTQSVMVEGAVTVFAGFESGAIGTGEGAVTTQGKFAARIGKSSAYVTMLRRLGMAIVRHGITPEDNTHFANGKENHSPNTWTMLASKSGVNRAAVAAFLAGEAQYTEDKMNKNTPETLREALLLYFDDAGKPLRKAPAGNGGEGAGTPDTSHKRSAVEVVTDVPVTGLAEAYAALVARIVREAENLSTESLMSIGDSAASVEKLVHDQHVAREAAKPRKRTPAKKTA